LPREVYRQGDAAEAFERGNQQAVVRTNEEVAANGACRDGAPF
jgi:hypothetical protein